jgi:hypothetical protein
MIENIFKLISILLIFLNLIYNLSIINLNYINLHISFFLLLFLCETYLSINSPDNPTIFAYPSITYDPICPYFAF